MEKVEPYSFMLAHASQADSLTRREYTEVLKLNWFPDVPAGAENISYSYDYDGFLPDYNFSLTYDLPKTAKVELIEYKSQQFSRRQTFEIKGDKKRVYYSQSQW